ncbi:PerC family transcriptional regulator [Enterobacter sp. CGMCC 5087]|uniref:PerC family transcriptional regulator n=1 Tax=Enterobacter sp. CGMCC 5087 TaxID=2183878 RepID=UPI000D67BCD8|nr:PerC family transcriptional regulator [Enterobacter sp. CGMCC 5087]PWI77135.1 PerC family transcriptional regulator [Enterobacter sp. CGMCC 5087]
MVIDNIAERLESAGLWRRAAVRWLDVLQICETDRQREWVCRRRYYCLSNVKIQMADDKLYVHSINRAANITLAKMGISQPNGVAYRIKTKTYEV